MHLNFLGTMKYLLFIIIVFGIGNSVFSKDKVTEADILGEENYRLTIAKQAENLRTKFYFFDGRQTFGIFEDPRKDKLNMLLIVLPAYQIRQIHFEINGKNADFESKSFSVVVHDYNSETGKAGRQIYVQELGRWFTVNDEDSIFLKIEVATAHGEWTLTARKEGGKEWQGKMRKRPVKK